MGMLTKIMVVVNLVLAIGVAALTFTLWAKQVNWVKQTEKATNEHNQVKEQNAALARELETLKRQYADKLNTVEKERDVANAKVLSVTKESDSLSKQLADAKAAGATKDATISSQTQLLNSNKKTIDTLNADLAKTRKEAADARQVAEKAKAAAIALAAELQSAVDQVKDLMAQRGILMQRVDALENQMKRYQEEFGAIPVSAAGEAGGPNIEGLVLKIDAPSKLIVVNKGERDGAYKGLTLTLSRGDKYLGKAVVSQVMPDMLIAAISEMTPEPQAIQVGDAARTLY